METKHYNGSHHGHYFTNGISDSSEDEDDNHLTFVNKVKREECTNPIRNNQLKSIRINTFSNRTRSDKGNIGTQTKAVQTIFSDSLESDSSDEENKLDFKNTIHQNKWYNKNETNAGKWATNANEFRGQHPVLHDTSALCYDGNCVLNDTKSESTLSTVSSHFENFSGDSSDDEQMISLTFNNNLLIDKRLDKTNTEESAAHTPGHHTDHFDNGFDNDEGYIKSSSTKSPDHDNTTQNIRNENNVCRHLVMPSTEDQIYRNPMHLEEHNVPYRKIAETKEGTQSIEGGSTMYKNVTATYGFNIPLHQTYPKDNATQSEETRSTIDDNANPTDDANILLQRRVYDKNTTKVNEQQLTADINIPSHQTYPKYNTTVNASQPEDIIRTTDDNVNPTGDFNIPVHQVHDKVNEVESKESIDILENDIKSTEGMNFPFRSVYNSTGMQLVGKSIFEMRLQENITSKALASGTSSSAYIPETDDSDIEIDSENSSTFTKQKKEQHEPKAEKLKKKIKPNLRRQTPTEDFGHTCSGCGRKDCDGNFMRMLREMIRVGRKKGFEIRNVVPDGNCMFAAVIDQMELLKDCHSSPFALRQSCVEFLKSNPNSQDGTPYWMFLDGESWEDYLSMMQQEGRWGDHLMLQAISNVTKRTVCVIKGEDEKQWTKIQPAESAKPEYIYLGHVGELHYVSMRPVGLRDDDELMSLDLYSLTPSLPSLQESDQQQMFEENYIDPWSDIPAVHLSYLIKQFIPFKSTLKRADSICHQAFAIESSTEEFMGQKSERRHTFQIKGIGDVVEGLFASSLDNHGQMDRFSGEYADVGIIVSLTTCIAYPKSMSSSETMDESDVIIDTSHTHPGYVRLLAMYPNTWEIENIDGSTMTYYIPNTHKYFEDDEAKRFKEQYSKDNPTVVYLFKKSYSGMCSPFWPEGANEWRYRQRDSGWPTHSLVDSIVSEGVYYISNPHVKSSNPGIEFQTCFGVAERRLANEGLSKDQRYCFIVFKALVSHALMGDEVITPGHLKSIFLYACEQIPEQFWASRLSSCVLFMLDNLIKHLETKCLPNYFIPSNNMIDYLSNEQIKSIFDTLQNLRTNPITSLYSVAYQNLVMDADEIFQLIRFDIEDFKIHKSVRQTVIETLVPAKIKQAAKYIEFNKFDFAIEMIQEAHEDRLMVSTCEDNIPFVAFVTEVTNSFGLSKQWWLCHYADETLGTSLSVDLSLQHDPIPLWEIVGNEVADSYGELLIPRPLAENLCTFCNDFYKYLESKHKIRKAAPFLAKARECLFNLEQYGVLPGDFPCTVNREDFNPENVFKIYSSIVQNFVMGSSSEHLFTFTLIEIANEVEFICKRVNTEVAYSMLVIMWTYLGNPEKQNEASLKLDELAVNHATHSESEKNALEKIFKG